MHKPNLINIANSLVAPGKGILAADESVPTINKRFKVVGIQDTESNRRDYREMLFGAEGAEQYISGVILFDETMRQNSADGTPFVDVLRKKDIIPGIKVDRGTVNLTGSPGEKITEGLDGLRERLIEYHQFGARFAKWRAVINIAENQPSDTCLIANAQALGRYAALCQEQEIVPIVEPEIIMVGSHSIERCYEVTDRMLHFVFNAMYVNKVLLEGMLLKPNMIISGSDCEDQANSKKIAELTIQCFYRRVPAAIPGILFLSGGQTEEQATANLNAINASSKTHPWEISFSFGRALQATALGLWAGKRDQLPIARRAFIHRAQLNGAARAGTYTAEMEKNVNKM